MVLLNAISLFFVTIFLYLISLLPAPDPTVTTFLGNTQLVNFRDWMEQANWIFPVDTLAWVLGVIFVTEGIIFLWHLLRYLLGLFTGGAAK